MNYAGFWIRLVAVFLDTLILMVANCGLGFTIGLYGSLSLEQLSGPQDPALSLIQFLLGTVVGWGYSAGLTCSSYQGTLGKKIMGIKVVGADGERISFGRATGRFFATYLSTFLCCVGYLMVAFNAKKQGLHDLIAETYVVHG